MHIEVTQEDIDNGLYGDPCKCPIALAARRCASAFVKVSPFAIEIGDGRSLLPDAAVEFIRRFDAAQKVEPFGFEIQ